MLYNNDQRSVSWPPQHLLSYGRHRTRDSRLYITQLGCNLQPFLSFNLFKVYRFLEKLLSICPKFNCCNQARQSTPCKVSLEYWLLRSTENTLLPSSRTSLTLVVITFLRLHCWHFSLASCTLYSRIWKQIIVVVRAAGRAGPQCVLPTVCYLFRNPRETEL